MIDWRVRLFFATAVSVVCAAATGPQVTFTPLPLGSLGVSYSATLTATGGVPPYGNWTISSGSLSGLTLNAATGAITGTPMNLSMGSDVYTATFSVTVQDSKGNLSPEQTLYIFLAPPVTISQLSPPGGTIGTLYTPQTLTATGGIGAPYTWAVSSGSLPPGLTLNPETGLIGGRPTTATGSPFSFSVTVTDAAGRASVARSFSIAIASPVTAAPTTLTLTGPVSPARYGQPLTLTASVTPAAAAGKVTFYDGLGVLGTSPVSGGQAALTTILLGAGSHSLHAYFNGLPFYSPSSSAALGETVNTVAADAFRLGVNDSSAGVAMAVGDFNGDGKADLANGNGVVLGNGDGTFGALIPLPAPAAVISTIGDFNGDGIADLATDTGVMLGNGDGTFQPLILYPLGGYAATATVGDFNGDGIADLAIGSGVMLGNGDGTFQPTLFYTDTMMSPLVEVAGYHVAVGDFNGDGKADVFVAYVEYISFNFNGFYGLLLAGNGDGTFQTTPTARIDFGVAQIDPPALFFAAADFNGDGKADLLVSSAGGLANYPGITIYPGNGDGTFGTPNSYASYPDGAPGATGVEGLTAAVSDFNGDGKLDIAIGAPANNAVELFTGNGDGTFQPGVLWSGGVPPALNGQLQSLNVLAGDFNGDGRVDIISSFAAFDAQQSQFTVLLGSAASVPQVNASALPAGTIGVSYSATLTATGGSGPPYAWSMASGSLPPGLTLNATTGTIGGTPTTATGFLLSFSVAVTDPAGSLSAATSFSITVAAPITPPVITAISPSSAAAGSPSVTITITGTGFTSGTGAQFNGLSVTTTFVDSTTLTAQIPASDLLNPGTAQITVVNTTGTTSNSFPFFITSSALQFRAVPPCRIMDTRTPAAGGTFPANSTFGSPDIAAGTVRAIPIPSSTCGIPANALAYSLNVTVVPRAGALDYLTVWPVGQVQPFVSTLNSLDGSTIANAVIVPAGTAGAINAYATNDTDLIVDINGYFVPPAANTLQFYPLPPCRVLDTRNPTGTFGGPSIAGGASRSFPISASSCAVPATAAAYAFNVTVVPQGPLEYLTAWPTGQPQPFVSTLNSLDGTVLANAAIVAAGTGGAVSFYATNTADLVVDINGYFALPASGGLNFYTATPCRLVDTRNPTGTFGGPTMGVGTTRVFPLSEGSCGLPGTPAGQAYSLNITVVPQGALDYLSIWATGEAQPFGTTLNAFEGQIVANAAIVPAGGTGSIDVYVTNTTDVVIDTNGYFGP